MQSNLKKVLFITYTHSNGGGAEKVLTTLVNNLDKNKYDITIQEVTRFNVKKEKINGNIKLKKFPLDSNNKITKWFSDSNYYFLYFYPEVLKTVFKWEGFDVIISWNYQLPSFALNAFDKEYKVSHFHGAIDDLNINNNPFNKKQYFQQRNVWNKVDQITTISKYSKESAENIYPEFKGKIKIIYNGTDINEISKESKEYLFDISRYKGKINLVSVARLDENKNISLVLNALSILKSENKLNFNYFIVGDGDCRKKLEEESKLLSLEDSVFFLGFIKNPMPIIKECDILCLSSFSEGWPTVVTEAMALHKTFVTTPVAGAKDELSNNDSCGLVSDFNPINYAEKITILANDSTLRKKMGENGYKNIQNYSVSRYVDEFEKIINQSKSNNILFKKFNLINYFKYVFITCVNIPQIYKNISYISEHKRRLIIQKKISEFIAIIYRCIILILDVFFVPILIIPRAICASLYCIILGVE